MSEFEKVTTIQDLAKQAIEIQNACNLSGIVHAFSKAVTVMRTELKMDTPTCNRHPVTVLFLDKLNSLAGIQPLDTEYMNATSHAMDECLKLVLGG